MSSPPGRLQHPQQLPARISAQVCRQREGGSRRGHQGVFRGFKGQQEEED